MNDVRWLMAVVVLAFFLDAARAGGDLNLPICFLPIKINDKPSALLLDTAFPASGTLDSASKRLGLKSDGNWSDMDGALVRVSKPVAVFSAGQTIMAPIPVMHLPWWVKLLLHMTPVHLDGVVGWPEIRDNILVFDAGTRVIRSVDKLPPETSGWLKLKVVPDDFLLLELPLTNGETGLLTVDTLQTSPVAVMMSETPWKEWKAQPHKGKTNAVAMGPLTLLDASTRELPASDANDLLYEIPGVKEVWKLGFPALSRMDLVVDAKNGWAYAHPKPRSALTNLPPDDAKWTVDDTVRIFRDNFLVYSAAFKWWNGDVAGAEADYTEAAALNPRNADAWSGLGSVREVKGDFAGAVGNYDRVIALRPRNSEWEHLYRQTLQWRLGGPALAAAKPPAAPAVVLDAVVVHATEGGGNKRWARTIHLYLDGSMDDAKLLELAKHSDGEEKSGEQKSQAEYYIGMVKLAKGDLDGARAAFQKCRKYGSKKDLEYFYAESELKRLDAIPQSVKQ